LKQIQILAAAGVYLTLKSSGRKIFISKHRTSIVNKK
jgi:hypothetical protein